MSDINIKISLAADKAIKNTDKLNNGLAKTEKNVNGLTLAINNSTSAFKVFAGTLASKAVAKLGASVIQATKSFARFGLSTIKAAVDVEETISKFNVVFADVRAAADETAENLAQNFGLASDEAKKLLSDTGDLLTGFGFSGKAALDLSNDVQKLAVDLASFSNFSGGAKGASEALTKALLGERESVKALGISILEEDVKKQVAINSAKGLTFESERQAKAQATLDIALRQSKNAIGDYARTQDGAANQARLAQARFRELQTEVGKELVPAYAALQSAVANYVTDLRKSGQVQAAVANVAQQIPDIIDGIGQAFIFVSGAVADARSAINFIKAGFAEFAVSAIDVIVGLNKAEIAVKSFLGVDTSNLEAQNKELKLYQAELKNVANAALDSTLEIQKSQESLERSTLEVTEKLKVSYKERLTAAQEAAKGPTEEEKRQAAERKRIADEENARLQQEEADRLARLSASNQASFEIIKQGLGERQALKTLARVEELQADKEFKEAALLLEEESYQATKAIDEKRKKDKEDRDKRSLRDQRTFNNDFIRLTEQGNGVLAALGKSAALQQIEQKTPVAVANAFEFGTRTGGPPLGFVFGALAAAAMNSLKSAVGNFENGGIVPGSSFSGDNLSANVNSGEMILNRQQQSTLFDIANGAGGGSSKEIVVHTTVELDGEAVGKSVSRQVADGLQLGENI